MALGMTTRHSAWTDQWNETHDRSLDHAAEETLEPLSNIYNRFLA
jgi:hypothetical protein